MTTSRATAFLPGGRTNTIPVADSWATADAGVPVLVPGLLRATGYLDAVLGHVVAATDAVAGPAAAARLRVEGIERLHEVCTPDQVSALLDVVDGRLAPVAFPLEHALVSATAPGLRRRYFASVRLLVRALLPLAVITSGGDEPAGRFTGRLQPLDRHRDTDHTHPRHAVSYWAALGPARAGNALALYPEAPPRDATAVDPGPPLVPELDTGDVLVFPARMLHASVPNHTGESRVVVSFRMASGRFLRYSEGTNWHPYADARLAGTRIARLATWQSKATPAAARSWWAQHRPGRG